MGHVWTSGNRGRVISVPHHRDPGIVCSVRRMGDHHDQLCRRGRLDVICLDARHARVALRMQLNKIDPGSMPKVLSTPRMWLDSLVTMPRQLEVSSEQSAGAVGPSLKDMEMSSIRCRSSSQRRATLLRAWAGVRVPCLVN